MSDSTSAVRVVEAAMPTPARYPRSSTRAPFASGFAVEPEEQNTAVETDHVAVERRLLDDALRPGAVALDAGCGRTTRLRFFRDRIVRLVGVDADAAAASENPSVDEYVHADLDVGLPFEDGTFDLVYANFVVEHLSRPEHAIAEWRRVLRPGGRVVLLTSNRANPAMAVGGRIPSRARLVIKRRGAGAADRDVYPTHYRANTPSSLAEATAAGGLEPVVVEYVATLHRYGARVPLAATGLRWFELGLPARRRSTIVASYRAVGGV
jgi:SAM-dependent methyltransferase